MIFIYQDYDYTDMPLGGWDTNCFDGRLCEEDYSEKIIDFINFMAHSDQPDYAIPKPVPQWTFSSNHDGIDYFMPLLKKLLPSRRSKACLWKRSTNTTGQNRKRGVEYRSISFSCHTNQAQCRTIRYCVCRLSLRRKAAQRILRRGQRLKWKSRPCSRILKYRNDRLKIWSSLSRGHTNTRTWTSLPRMLCVSLSKEFILKHPTRAAASGDRTSAFPMILWVLSR